MTPARDAIVELADADAWRALVDAAPLVSEWVRIDQPCIDTFADATGDRQWIHVDPERAARESPFGGTVVHGFLTLSMIPSLLEKTVAMRQRMAVNYGLNRVRFTAPVPAGSRVRARFQVEGVTDVDGGGVQVVWNVTLEAESGAAEDGGKPACVAEFITRHYF
ncbi:MaoC family dehydratase [Trinickia terrae]|uniref:MaoC family dehydratase n=1 Tax=Trinickia terrae TaxID=2571161 RepID=A0A4U1HG90_9BURK|nr:MaoC family dehydratase [Trinickia terrae]TKC80065.1 MaoC family dehydratase [Trinickia terrae]